MSRFRAGYTLTALVIVNTIALFTILNFAASAWLQFLADEPATYERAWLIEGYGLETLERNYPGLTRDEVTALLFETSNWVQEYEPFTGFRPVARRDRFITISPEGFRPVPQQTPWPPPDDRPAIFLFGGSTMMGAGVPDDSTIAAHLRNTLTACSITPAIYNFGRGFYFSTQERILFEQLLVTGHRPALAVFLDGLNDFYFADGVPQFTPDMMAFMKGGASTRADESLTSSLVATARNLPLVRAAMRLGGPTPRPFVAFGAGPARSTRPESDQIQDVLTRWERNRSLIRAAASASGVRTAFVWQPVPTYGYDQTKLSVYRPGIDLFGAHTLSGLGYPEAAKRYRNGAGGNDVLWLGDMQRDRAENLYVDAVHYTSRFSADIALQISDFLTREALVPCDSGTNGK